MKEELNKLVEVKEEEQTIFVPVKARLSTCSTGQSFLAIDDNEIAKFWFMDKVEKGYDSSKSFREHLIIYNKVQLEELSFYEKGATYFRHYGDNVLIICIYGVGLHFVFGVKKNSVSPKNSVTMLGMRVFFVNKWKNSKIQVSNNNNK